MRTASVSAKIIFLTRLRTYSEALLRFRPRLEVDREGVVLALEVGLALAAVLVFVAGVVAVLDAVAVRLVVLRRFGVSVGTGSAEASDAGISDGGEAALDKSSDCLINCALRERLAVWRVRFGLSATSFLAAAR
ncbi:hypothetical protein C7B61_05595 [filamentous cyanobacterium CCP1]|nr:hypothetical protein C7B61_05595 [filamentous cyanobacterium CCP1]